MEQPALLGEQEWRGKLEPAILTARNIQDRVAVMELCAQAVAEVPHSPRLWQIYGNWMWTLYRSSHQISGVYETCELDQLEVDGTTFGDRAWSEEDMAVGRDIFQWEQMMDVWKQGITNTQWHMNNSHLVWDPYLELSVYTLAASPSSVRFSAVSQLFHKRLQIPHRSYEQTKDAFKNFVGRHDEHSLSQASTDAGKLEQKYQSVYVLRSRRERELDEAWRNGDIERERRAFEDYLIWEEDQHRAKTMREWGHNLYIALCQRATLRFPKDKDFWLDLMLCFKEPGHDKNALLETAERATKYCQGSGDLWAERLCAMEACGRPYKEIETVKHNATSTGQLEDNGQMQQLIKVDVAWCSYLRRNAFLIAAGADGRDVAEVAIRSAIENVARVGRDKYGDAFRGDPEFRVERIYLKFLAQAGAYDEARELFRRLEATHGDSHFFWERWYLWEMTVWESSQDTTVQDKSQSIPTHATAALKRAMQRPQLDWPEKVVDMYVHHCTQHETAQALLEAKIMARKFSKRIVRRRREEAEAYAQQQAAYEHMHAYQPTGKRHRDEEDVDMSDAKRPRTNEPAEQSPLNNSSSSATSQLKRDRENTTVVVRHLPLEATDHTVRQYFRDCGEIKAIRVIPDDSNLESTATIEFASQEDVLTAQTKSMKTFADRSIDVQVGTGTTLFVTNYPPQADETYIRSLFQPHGDVVEVRLPSLKANTHRRFCYVQFISASQAAAASAALHNKMLEHGHRLSALLSEPEKMKARAGALEESREIYIGNFHWHADERNLRDLLNENGCVDGVETLRIPRNLKGMSKGAAFAVFATKEQAEKAVQKLNSQVFRGRVLTVTIAKKNTKAKSTTVVTTRRGSTAASDRSASQHAGDAASPLADTPMSNTAPDTRNPEPPHLRTLALLNIPDTINDARVQALCDSYGSIIKIILKPENGGALIEFEHSSSCDKAKLALSGYEIASGIKVRIGKPWEVTKGPKRSGDGDQKKADTGGGKGLIPAAVRRPVFGAGGKTRGRGGRAGLGFARAAMEKSDVVEAEEGGKSQNDFRALLAGGGESGNDDVEKIHESTADAEMQDPHGQS